MHAYQYQALPNLSLVDGRRRILSHAPVDCRSIIDTAQDTFGLLLYVKKQCDV